MATILIVEDDLLIAAEIERILYRLGHAPLEPVDNCGDALAVLAVLAVLARQPVELVLMDINIAGDCDEGYAHFVVAAVRAQVLAGKIKKEGGGRGVQSSDQWLPAARLL